MKRINEITAPDIKGERSGNFRGSHRCIGRRALDKVGMTHPASEGTDRVVTAIDVIGGFFAKEIKMEEISELTQQGIANKMTAARAARDLVRYLTSETRAGKRAVSKTLAFGPVDDPWAVISIRPSFIFQDASSIEAVIIRCGKPDISKKGRGKDTGVQYSIELFAALCYAASLVPEGEYMNIKASYYFLRKSKDSATGGFDTDFFNDAAGRPSDNIVSLEQLSYRGGDEVKLLDDFEEIIKDFVTGENCSGDACDSCPYKAACQYQPAPEPFEIKDLEKKAGREIVYSEEQMKVLDFRAGYAKVVAGAGSGKTECMTERICRMILEGCRPEEILAITFTDLGAQEMRDRIAAKAAVRGIVLDPDNLPGITFHKLGYQWIKDNFQSLGFSKCPTILDTDEVRKRMVVHQILLEADFYTLTNKDLALNWAIKAFAAIKEHQIDVDAADAADALNKVLADVSGIRFCSMQDIYQLLTMYRTFNNLCIENCWLLFSDIEPLMNRIARENPEYIESLGYRHIIVDEFQDSNDQQLETIRALIGTKCFESLMVVGDDHQSIYGFRNTTQENILHFWEKIGVQGEDYTLSCNRRSTAEILAMANAFIAKNPDQSDLAMVTGRTDSVHYKPVVRGFGNEETSFIVEQIKAAHEKGGYAWEDICIIGRTRAELVNMASALGKAGIPWITKYPMDLIDNSRVQAALNLAQAFYQPDADLLYFNYLVALTDGKITSMSQDEIKCRIDALKDQWKGMDYLEIEYQRVLFHEKLEALKGTDELYTYFLELLYQCEDLQSELEYCKAFFDFGASVRKKLDGNYAGVSLITAHSAKGLEWPVVFVSVSRFDDYRQHNGGSAAEAAKEETRRLIYVALTRARDVLYVTGQMIAYGNQKDGYTYNQFLRELYEVSGKVFLPEQEIAQSKYRAQQAKLSASKAAAPSGTSREMTPEEIEEYNRLTAGAEQMSFQ